jgi:hypothetical protein
MTFKNKRNRTYCACHLYRKLIYFLLKKIETNFDLCLSEIIIIFLIWSVLDYKLYYIKLTGLYVIISIHHFYANVTVCHINKMEGETDTVRQVFCSVPVNELSKDQQLIRWRRLPVWFNANIGYTNSLFIC